jgi:ABC-type transport system involved in multi-copper enzyme maturation permease subunit
MTRLAAIRPFRPQVRALAWKEVRQLSRSKTAIVTGIIPPTVTLVLAPAFQLLYLLAHVRPVIPPILPGLVGLHGLRDLFLYVTFPLSIVLAGLLTPSLATSYTVVIERERRSIDLLMSLPVTVADILTAKIATNMVTAVAIVPFFALDLVAVLLLTGAGLTYVLAALLLLLSALVAAVGVSLFVALLARDSRTSDNLRAIYGLPTLALAVLCVGLTPGLWRFVVLAVAMLLMGSIAFYAGLRWLTFERYLS